MLNKSFSKIVAIPDETIRNIVLEAGICDDIVSIGEPVAWVLQSYKISLADGRILLLQFCHQDFADEAFVESRVNAIEMLQKSGIPQPAVISYSLNDKAHGFRYILSENHTGNQLFQLYPTVNSSERLLMYKAIAEAYSKIHAVKSDWAGIWNGNPNKSKYNIHPAQFYLNAEIKNGSNKQLFDNNMITLETYKHICSAWENNLDFLMSREVSLVHVNSFPWNIRCVNKNELYTICGLSGIEFMWWDSMYDAANLLYPPFMNITDEERKVFIENYNCPINQKAINLYRLLNRILAFTNCFMAPVTDALGDKWISDNTHELNKILAVIEEK